MFAAVSPHIQLFNESFHHRPATGLEYIRSAAPYTVIDKESFEAAELPALHESICSVVPKEYATTLGKVALLSSMISPPTQLDEILARQEALKEIASNETLRNGIEAILRNVVETESQVLGYLSAKGKIIELAGQLRSFKQLTKKLPTLIKDLPKIDSALLNQIFSDIGAFPEADNGKIVRGPTLATIAGLRPKEKAKFLPRYNYRPAPFDTVTLMAGMMLVAGFVIPGMKEEAVPEALRTLHHSFKESQTDAFLRLGGMMGIWLWPTMMKTISDSMLVHEPLVKRLRKDPELNTTLDALGTLGELYALCCANHHESPVKTTPEFFDADRFEFSTVDLYNPLVMLRGGQGIVPNSFTLSENRLVSIEGFNSGGKTFFCKSAFQTQILAQLGADVFASTYRCSAARRFFYHIVSSGTLENEDGNFGSGLVRAQQLFYDFGLDEHFFAVLDELAEGTTQREKIETAGPILHAFRIIGAGILWANHNHELVSMMPADLVDPWMIEMVDGHPTHKLVPGISTSSGAKRVVTKRGLDPDSLRAELHRRGLQAPEAFIGEETSL